MVITEPEALVTSTTPSNNASRVVNGKKRRPEEDGGGEDNAEDDSNDVADANVPSSHEALEDEETVKEKMINEEYKVWKKNAPFLYDLVVSHALEWPSLTVQWFPDLERPPTKDYFVQRLLLGTHTDGEQNYLQIATVQLPKDNYELDENEGGGEAGEDLSMRPTIEMDSRKYDEERGEFGGYGGASCRISIVQKIPHEGEVNRARFMPQNCCVIATKTVSGEVHIFDYTKHPSMPGPNAPVNPDLRLVGQAKEGYGLSWNPLRQGLLLSASLDGTIASWDVSQGSATQRTLDPLTLFAGKHSAGVEDVAWSPSESNIFVSVGDDRQVLFWDDRDPANLLASVGNAHAGDVNCVQFCPTDAFTVVTGGADGLVNLWDRRQLAQGPKHTLRHHQTDVVQVAWSPHFSNLLASSSSDRRVALWDFERIGRPQTPQDAEDGPPELLFVHGGHCNRVPDLAWNPHRPWMLCSVAEDNVMQVWQPSSELLEDDDDDDEDPDRG